MKNEIYDYGDDILILSLVIFMSALMIVVDINNIITDILRNIFGIFLILFVPGYLLINVVFPKRDDLGNIERVVLSVGLSITMISLIGLLTNFFFSIRLTESTLYLYLFDTFMIVMSIYRRKGVQQDERYSVSIKKLINNIISSDKTTNRNKITDKISTMVLLIIIVASIYLIYTTITMPKLGERFTEFYILNHNGYIINNTNNNTVRIGVSNFEYSKVNYTVKISNTNETILSQYITLDHDQVWEYDYIINNLSSRKFEFLLFKENDTEPYRKLHISVN